MMTSPDAYKPICRALLRAFDKENPDPEGDITLANDGVVERMHPSPLADLNNGQYAAMIDYIVQYGIDAFQASALWRFIVGGNLTKAVNELGPNTRGTRSAARRQAWNVGNSQ